MICPSACLACLQRAASLWRQVREREKGGDLSRDREATSVLVTYVADGVVFNTFFNGEALES